MPEDLAHFATLVEALRPYWHELVVVGGWAHRLYRFRNDARAPSHEPLFTTDTDIALQPAEASSKDLRERLLAAGFIEELQGDEMPPVTHYRLGEEHAGFYAEFLIPKIGGGGRPGKGSQHTAEIGGVVVQKLRYLDLLLVEPWPVMLRPRNARGLSKSVAIRVPNAASYIAQKLLIASLRRSADRAKDVLYIHDTIELFGASLDDLAALWRDKIRPTLPVKTAKKVMAATSSFSSITDTVRDAREIAAAAGRTISAEEIRGLVEAGVRELFAES